MNKFYILALTLAMGVVVGCVTNITGNPKTQVELAFGVRFLPEYGQYDNRVRFALKPLKGYGQDGKNSNMRWSDSYYFSEKNLPQTLNIQYAILLDEPTPVNKNIWEATNKKLQSLPPSAWRTYTINLQQVMEKAKREVPARHPDNIKDYPIGKNGTIIKLTLYIDGNGNITQEIDHIIDIGWVHT